MKKYLALVLVLIGVLVIAFSYSNLTATPGTKLLREAGRLERKADYFKAFDKYKMAWKELLKEENKKGADKSRIKFQGIEKILLSYPHSAEAVIKISKDTWPGIKEERVRSWMEDGVIDSIKIAGTPYYFDDFTNTIIHQNPDLMKSGKAESALGRYKKVSGPLFAVVFKKYYPKSWQVYTDPVNYLGKGTLDIPRDKLPKTGTFKMWIPLPVTKGPQTDIEIISIEPAKYVKTPAKIDGDIGLVYMEIPLEELKGNLKANVQFKYKRYQQHFRIDPENVGEYDKESDLYKWYTASRGNIKITPAIKKTAEKVAGGETNPYLIAKKMYHYVVEETNYSHLPHLAIEVAGIPESVYVHEKRIGDCGAQSMYFAALLRSLGIPARTPGGWQLFPGISGGHFWAEFYLPNYGWVPADTSVGQLAKYFPGMTETQRKEYKAFFFADMDSFRWTVQEDVDVPLIPPADEPIFLCMAIQFPAVLCDTMEEIPGVVLDEYWKMEIRPAE